MQLTRISPATDIHHVFKCSYFCIHSFGALHATLSHSLYVSSTVSRTDLSDTHLASVVWYFVLFCMACSMHYKLLCYCTAWSFE